MENVWIDELEYVGDNYVGRCVIVHFHIDGTSCKVEGKYKIADLERIDEMSIETLKNRALNELKELISNAD